MCCTVAALRSYPPLVLMCTACQECSMSWQCSVTFPEQVTIIATTQHIMLLLPLNGCCSTDLLSVILQSDCMCKQTALSLLAESGEDDDKKDKESGLAQLSGTWRLVYSSGFSSGSIGGRQPGPSASLLPARLGQVCIHTALPHGIPCLACSTGSDTVCCCTLCLSTYHCCLMTPCYYV